LADRIFKMREGLRWSGYGAASNGMERIRELQTGGPDLGCEDLQNSGRKTRIIADYFAKGPHRN
jgi:hypothetical protein